MNKALIWVEGWEMQCCGKPFRVDDIVSWTILEPGSDFPQISETDKVDYCYYEHGTPDDKLYKVNGIVQKIQIVYALHELSYRDGMKCLVPVLYRAIDFDGEATGWEKDMNEHELFCGFLVQLGCKGDLVAI